MDILVQIKTWSQEHLQAHLFVVDVEQKLGSRKISVFVDGDKGILLEECRQLSRFLSQKLDEQEYGDKPYTLEVSSPGVEKAMKYLRQFGKHLGRELLIKLKANSELSGKLISLDSDTITIQLKDNKKGYKVSEPVIKIINFADVAECFVQVSFN